MLLIIPVLFLSCKKEDTNKCTYTSPTTIAPASEITYLQNWLTSQGITATQDNSGLFYKINEPGAGNVADVCNTVQVNYSGMFLNGGTFDSGSTTFLLGQLVAGWQLGLPKIKQGGSITLYLPPTLGYGDRDIRDENNSIRIPANSYLIFNIQLIQVN